MFGLNDLRVVDGDWPNFGSLFGVVSEEHVDTLDVDETQHLLRFLSAGEHHRTPGVVVKSVLQDDWMSRPDDSADASES